MKKRYCKQCDDELIKRKYESKKRYSEKQFCSTKCSRKYMKKNKLGWWKHDVLTPRPVREKTEEEKDIERTLDEFGL